MKKIKNKKTIIILLLLCIGVVGITIAYFSNSTILDNLFSTKPYGTTYTETFVSPDNWLPGDTTDKTVTVTNSGSVDEAVRISLTESWKSNNGTTLSGLIDENGLLTDIEENSEKAAIINFSNTDDWTYNNGYYYYNYRLKPNETTSSFIESVTFNPKVSLGDNCTETESNGKKTITCNSSGDDYDNATYKLTLKIETVQYNKYMSAWNTDIAIANEQTLFCDAFDVGEVVDYNGSEYYVLKDSSTSDDYVTLLKKEPLTASEVNQYSDNYVSQDGEYPYYESDTCNENNQTGCINNYDDSDVKKIIDEWSSNFSDDLVEIDGYKTRLINENDIIEELKFELYSNPSDIYYKKSSYTPLFSFLENNNSYWTMFTFDDSSKYVNTIYSYNYPEFSGGADKENVNDKSYIRPVINLKKSVIIGTCISNNNTYLSCETGDEVIYNSELYYVLEDSDINKKSVKLLKANVLSVEEVNNNSDIYTSQEGEYPYYESDTCTNNNYLGCSVNYNTSSIKSLIDNWSNNFQNDLVKIEGYKARLININEIYNFGYDYVANSPWDGSGAYYSTAETPTWFYINNKKYWSMINDSDSNLYIQGISNISSSENIYNKLYVRPVINLKKDAIESGCSIYNKKIYDKYSIGQNISYNSENYCVIKNSKISEDYVTLIKQNPLTYEELITYNNGYEIGRDNEDNNVGTISYYKSNDCYYNSDYDKNTTGCSSNYDTSNIKNVIDNWSNTFNDVLEEINGYKARLITYDEIMNIGYSNVMHGTQYYLEVSNDTKCSGFKTWYNGGKIVPTISRYTYISQLSPVRPVINLKKCAITNTCE